MPNTIDKIPIGNIVLFLYPTPNSRKVPFFVYKKAGLSHCNIPKMNKNKQIETDILFFLA